MKAKKTIRKWTTWLLIVLMVCGMMPVQAMAASGSFTYTVSRPTGGFYSASGKAGGTTYTELFSNLQVDENFDYGYSFKWNSSANGWQLYVYAGNEERATTAYVFDKDMESVSDSRNLYVGPSGFNRTGSHTIFYGNSLTTANYTVNIKYVDQDSNKEVGTAAYKPGKYGSYTLNNNTAEVKNNVPGGYTLVAGQSRTTVIGKDGANPSELIFYVKKDAVETQYILKYNANGGAGAPADQTKKTDADSAVFTVSSTEPTRDGWTFLGWADTAEATVAVYTAGDKLTLQKGSPTKTIYAVWEGKQKEKYTITYKDGTATVGTDIVTEGESTAVHAALTDPDKIFKGWAVKEGGDVVYLPGDTIKPTGDMTLYAVWENKKPHTHKDEDDDGFCDDDNECMHEKDSNGYCTEDNCTHPHGSGDCCPLKPTTPGGDDEEKENYPSMEKTVNDSDKVVIKVNDEVTFKLASNLPDDLMDYVFVDKPTVMSLEHDSDLDVQKGSGHYYLVFHDEMTDGLDWDGTIESVKIGTLELKADEDDYELTADDDMKGFTLKMDLISLYDKYGSEFKVNTDTEVTPVVVTYKATYTGSTAEDGNANNKAWVDYTNATSSNADEADVYNGKIIVTKVDSKQTEKLAGAEFELLDANKDAVLDEDGKPVTGTTGEDGVVTFTNLPSGTYYVRETKAPKGYVKKDDPIQVVISASENELHVVRNVTCFNTKVPFTGGSGTLLFTVIGLAVMGGAGAAYMASRKKKKN